MFLLRVLPWTGLFWFAYLVHANRRPEEQVPVSYARLREVHSESEVMVRLKGLLSRGNVAADDQVSFDGMWRDGVLMATHGMNHRTQTAIDFHRSRWWLGLLLTSVLAAGMAARLHGVWISISSTVPWQ